ncbi:MAG: DUF2116 family Zn-ribbon domain-containing protein [Candidatus Lokiarchaeota archaeon]|nr:DUF2116 family Zn-ribbon domain-containing protein [Candidatus Lokiarchaeota archaeon]
MSQATWKDQIKKKWGPHSHCPICGKAMPPDKQFCSQNCRDNYHAGQKKQKKKSRIQMIFMVGMMAVLFLFLFIFSP